MERKFQSQSAVLKERRAAIELAAAREGLRVVLLTFDKNGLIKKVVTAPVEAKS